MPRQSDLSFAFAPASGAAFDVVSFRLEEAISRPYLLTVELSSIDPTIDFGTLLDKSALLTIRRGDADVRYVHGIVTAFEQGKTGFRRTFYRAEVEPQLAGARLRSDWKIFQQENAPAILQTVLKRSGINDAVQTLTKEHLVREYCVQPGETDFQFFQRLSAEEGLFYTHTFSATGHRLTLSDRLYIYGAIEGGPVIYAAAIGMDVAIGFDSARRPMDSTALAMADVEMLKSTGGIESGTALNYRVVLPGFDPALSRYSFTLEVERFGVRADGGRAPSTSKQTLASGQLNDSGAVSAPTSIARPDYTLDEEIKPTAASPVLSGSYWLDAMNGMKSATLSITYWPDKTDQSGFAQITLTEEA
ncbi:hypothetical protein FHX57_001293 [Paraburkholderia tropica]|uniref:type VI secretion system tip protein VgrG n=1 Tax=Paraburkholderia tropica TaxID=92647 RepID=UPI0016121967|nr:type VI secretion system tip protein VgrG [Paraburkholderia tropica]MBB2998965.1 hypothetical protein [Paraburkholderia tropica]MBB6318260.1 hypothetical protein [Paraburkholderia tropica]